MKCLDSVRTSVLALVLPPLLFGCAESSDPVSDIELRRIGHAIFQYTEEFGRLPQSNGMFDAEMLAGKNPRKINFLEGNSRRALLKLPNASRSVFVDVWKNPIVITFLEEGVILRSFGKDGIRQIGGGTDDLEHFQKLPSRIENDSKNQKSAP